MSADNIDMQEPLLVEELSSKVLKLELLLERANKERARVEQEAKEERDVLNKQLNAVTVDHEERLKLKEDPRISLEERKRKIAEAKSHFKNPQDKRAVGKLVDIGLDVNDLSTNLLSLDALREVLCPGEDGEEPELGQLNLDDSKVQLKVMEVLALQQDIVTGLARKIKMEKEDYFMARQARGDWKTVAVYSGDNFVDLANQDLETVQPHDKPELSSEEKMKKFKEAEATVKWYENASKNRNVRLRGRGSSSSFVSSSSKFFKGGDRRAIALRERRERSPPTYRSLKPSSSGTKGCFSCGKPGHLAKHCFSAKSDSVKSKK